MTAEELIDRVRHVSAPSPDDVSILWNGRRLDSPEAVMKWLAEVDAKRAEETAAPAPMPEPDGPPHDLGRLLEVLDRDGPTLTS
jgi:hypothetical protein